MLDRQDIDALLIGALYGELTPADEARLQAHLESHPADKSALADLTTARAAVRDSRFLTVQLEPPQAVSAMLLQEASRRAPAKVVAKDEPRESWFQRFVASFARNPAWAAAAMLVLVVGVAGTMYLRGGSNDQFAGERTTTFDSENAPAMAPAPEAAATPPSVVDEAKLLEQSAGSGYTATLAEPEAAKDRAVADPVKAEDKATQKKSDEPANASPVAKAPVRRTYIGTPSKELKPMDLDGAPKGGDFGMADDARGRVTTGQARPPANDPQTASPPPPAPPRAATVRGGAGGAPGAGEDVLRDAKPDNEETTWAREQHTKVTNAVRANNCRDASSLALQLSNRAPAYYTQNVEQDRSLKQCMTYINAEREREAERQQRARAIQRRNAEEADRAKRSAPASIDKSTK